MRALARLTEELESRPADADRVDALARWLRTVGQEAGALAAGWLVLPAPADPRPARPPRVTAVELAQAARELAARHGVAPWLFDAGRAASDEAAEAIALLLPWPEGEPTARTRPAFADWLADWSAAAARPGPERAAAVAQAIAGLDDAMARRWAVRAACGLVRPLVDAWQWQRAWAIAFGLDARGVAWAWHARRDRGGSGEPDPGVPHPHEFAPLADAPDDLAAGLLDAWRRGEWRAEPRWSGLRVHIVRGGGGVAIWQRGAGLLNAHLPADWLVVDRWPERGAIEAVLLAWQAGRVIALAEARTPGRAAGRPRPTLHLALVDWHAARELHEAPGAARARLLERWPEVDPHAATALPAIFTMPTLPPADDAALDLQAQADATRSRGAGGLVLRHVASGAAWVVRTRPRRIRAVLQYVPGEALAADARAALALATVPCGFAVWNRAPLSEGEQHAAMTASLSGEFLPPPEGDPGLDGLRLLPLARLPIGLAEDDLQALQAWLRAHAGQRFGGVHAVAPVQVFEIAYDDLRPSRRHRLGATLVGARVLRWLPEAAPGAADRVDELR